MDVIQVENHETKGIKKEGLTSSDYFNTFSLLCFPVLRTDFHWLLAFGAYDLTSDKCFCTFPSCSSITLLRKYFKITNARVFKIMICSCQYGEQTGFLKLANSNCFVAFSWSLSVKFHLCTFGLPTVSTALTRYVCINSSHECLVSNK